MQEVFIIRGKLVTGKGQMHFFRKIVKKKSCWVVILNSLKLYNKESGSICYCGYELESRLNQGLLFRDKNFLSFSSFGVRLHVQHGAQHGA